MKKAFIHFLITLCPWLAIAQHFGFSHEVSSYVQTGISEVQFESNSSNLCMNKSTGNLVSASGSSVVIVDENNGTVISRFGDENIFNAAGVATDNLGNYYVLQSYSVVKYDGNGDFVKSWGTPGAGDGQFNNAVSICTDNSNHVYVVDAGNYRVQKFDDHGNFLTKWGTNGTGNGQFKSPQGIVYWPALDRIIVGEFTNANLQAFTSSGTFMLTAPIAIGGLISLDVDVINNQLLVLTQNKIHQFDTSLSPVTNWGPNGVNGANSSFSTVSSIVVSSTSTPLINRVFAVESKRLISFFLGGASNGTPGASYGSNGTALGQFDQPAAADYSATGTNLYVVDWGKFDPVTSYSSATLNKGLLLKTPSSSLMKLPFTLTTDLNYQYIVDNTNIPTPSNHLLIHKFDLNNNFINTISIGIINIVTMTMDPSGNFYFVRQNGTAYMIYKFSNAGVLLTNWATPNTGVSVSSISLATDAANNVYATYSDGYTQTENILKYSSTGTLLNTFGSSGAGAGFLNGVINIDVDGNGNIYTLEAGRFQVFDASFNFLQKFDLSYGVKPGSVHQPFLIRVNSAGDNLAILDYKPLNRVQYFKIKTDQIISFAALPGKNTTDVPFPLSASGGASGNIVTFKSSNASVATVSGNTVTIVGGGTTTITASQAGTGAYNAAKDVSQQLIVLGKSNQVIQFNPLPAKNYGDASFQLSATGGASGNVITYVSSNLNVATVSGNTVTIVGAGSTTITASQAGNANFNAAPDVPQPFFVNGSLSQIITFNALADRTFGDPSFSLSAIASSGLNVSYSTTDDEVTITNSQVTMVKPGYVVIRADQGGNNSFASALQVKQGFCINPARPEISESFSNPSSPLLTSGSVTGNQWFLNDVVIAGATSNTYRVTEPGQYTVQVNAETCYSAKSDSHSVIITGLNKKEEENVLCYPNPATGFITIQAPVNSLAKVFIYNSTGQVMMNGGLEYINQPISITQFPSGIYFVNVFVNGKSAVNKFIKR